MSLEVTEKSVKFLIHEDLQNDFVELLLPRLHLKMEFLSKVPASHQISHSTFLKRVSEGRERSKAYLMLPPPLPPRKGLS